MTRHTVDLISRAGLKPGYVLVLYLFSVFSVEFAWRMTAGPSPSNGESLLRDLSIRGGAVVVALPLLALLPGMWAAMRHMFHVPSRRDFLPIDLLLALVIAYVWCMGVHHALVIMPSVWADPAKFYVFWGVGKIFRADGIGSWLLIAAWIGLATPILEELFFRGLLLDAWCAKRSTIASVILSSAVFGLTHGRMAIMAFGLGVVLALVYLRYRSLWPCIAIHGIYNVLQITPGLTSLTQGKSFLTVGSAAAWAFELALAAAFVPLAILFWRRFRPA